MAGMSVSSPIGRPLQPTTPKPVAPQVPYSTTIGGSTYIHKPRPAQDASGHTEFGLQEGRRIVSQDGSVWDEIPDSGGSATRKLSAAANGGASGDPMFDFNQAKAMAESMLPSPPRAAVLPPRVQPPPQADRTAAEAAAFGRAKDRIGQIGGGALKSLQSMMSQRGLAGSGIEGQAIADHVAGMRGELGDVVRDQAITGLQRDYAVEDRNFAGELGQRSTDVGFEAQTRGQDVDFALRRASMLPTLIELIRRSATGTIY